MKTDLGAALILLLALAHRRTQSFRLELARNLGLDLPLARSTKKQYDRMIGEGLGDLDNRHRRTHL